MFAPSAFANGALAIGACGSYGYATGGALARVQNQALCECYRNGGSQCVARIFACE